MKNHDTACVDSVESEAALPQYQETHFAVRFENGNYYTGPGFLFNDNRESDKLEYAKPYSFITQIPNDIYLKQYLYGTDRTYETLQVRVTKTYEVILPQAIETTETAPADKGVGVKEDLQ